MTHWPIIDPDYYPLLLLVAQLTIIVIIIITLNPFNWINWLTQASWLVIVVDPLTRPAQLSQPRWLTQ